MSSLDLQTGLGASTSVLYFHHDSKDKISISNYISNRNFDSGLCLILGKIT